MAEGDWHVVGIEIHSDRLRLRLFTADDAEDLFFAITPAITRFMQWEPPRSLAALPKYGDPG
ncbi:hypothetical protein [Mesorhizobium sp. M0491]|uniref:hypothetical protein n=1 Tax=Mesorhizobium sp. M0491 TaxID=2956950 RepID=UPI003338B3FF